MWKPKPTATRKCLMGNKLSRARAGPLGPRGAVRDARSNAYGDMSPYRVSGSWQAGFMRTSGARSARGRRERLYARFNPGALYRRFVRLPRSFGFAHLPSALFDVGSCRLEYSMKTPQLAG